LSPALKLVFSGIEMAEDDGVDPTTAEIENAVLVFAKPGDVNEAKEPVDALRTIEKGDAPVAVSSHIS